MEICGKYSYLQLVSLVGGKTEGKTEGKEEQTSDRT